MHDEYIDTRPDSVGAPALEVAAPLGPNVPITPQPGVTQTGGRVAALDGIRALAVTAVLLFHTGDSLLPGGYLGVDVFFVLSGFLITGILFREARREKRIALGRFWLRRARRLAPALLLLLFVLGVVRLLPGSDVGQAWRGDLLAALTYTTNWWEIVQSDDYFAQFGPESPVLNTWSLAIEEQFYVVFALFMALIARRLIRSSVVLALLSAATVGSIAAMYWATTSGALAWAYYGTVPRLQALLIGAILAIVHVSGRGPGVLAKWRDPIGLAGLAGLGLLLAGVWPPSFGPLYTVAALCAAAIVWSAVGGGRLAAVLGLRPLVLLGVISYGVYLWHWPVFLWLQGPDASLLVQAGSVALTLAVAVASFLIVERPVRQGRFVRLPTGAQWVCYLTGAAVVAALVMVPTRTPAPAFSDDPLAVVSDGDGDAPGAVGRPRPSRAWPADRFVPSRIATHGDSVILTMNLAFPHDKYPGRQVTGSTRLGCGLTPLTAYPTEGLLPPPADCAAWPGQWRRSSSELDPQLAVTGISGWDAIDRLIEGELVSPGNISFDRAFSLALESSLKIASRDGKIPVYLFGLPCFAAQKDGPVRNDPLRRQRLNELAQLVVQRVPGAEYVDLTEFTCDDGGTEISAARSKALYTDGVHWTAQGGRAVWALLLNRVREDEVARK